MEYEKVFFVTNV